MIGIFFMKRCWRGWIAAGFSFCAVTGAFGAGAGAGLTADDFKTAEYYRNAGLDMINAADAYARGYTGQGIVLGICDDYVSFSHPEFAGKRHSGIVGDIPAGWDWQEAYHGSHVGGIMAAARDGVGMHGVAFDADLLSGVFWSYDEGKGTSDLRGSYAAFCADERIRIINNSWAFASYYDDADMTLEGFIESQDNAAWGIFKEAVLLHDKVLVFGAGNDGHTGPASTALAPYMYPELAGNFLSVTCVDPAFYDKANQSAGRGFNVVWSNLAKYMEENTVAAPGFEIESLSPGDGGYRRASGTSMSAPFVSGTAGLVQQAFPYMNGKQIVDVILTTANSSFQLPDYTLSLQEREGSVFCINVFYFGDRPEEEALREDLRLYFRENGESLLGWYGIETVEQWLQFLDEYDAVIYENVPREMIFGQGLLDAGAAVRGPGLLNARRLDASCYIDRYGAPQALYSINTRGYDSVWSNDIGEKRAGLLEEESPYEDLRKIYAYYLQGDAAWSSDDGQDYINRYNAKVLAGGLKDLPVGLLKEGTGTLALEGNNTYQGASIAAGGVLQIDGRVAGDAWSVGEGTIGGSGTISGDLVNRGTVRAGSWGRAGTLNVGGDFSGGGVIEVMLEEGRAGMIAVAGRAGVDGSLIVLKTPGFFRVGESHEFLMAESIDGALAGAGLTGMLGSSARHDGHTAVVEVEFHNNMGVLTDNQADMYRRAREMYGRLEGDEARSEMDALFNLAPRAARATLTQLYGGAQLNLSAVTQRDAMISRALDGRFEGAGNEVISLNGDGVNDGWLQMVSDWGRVNGDEGLPGYDSRSFGLVMGYDRKVLPDWRLGALVGFGTNRASGEAARAENEDCRVGLYGEYRKAGLDVRAYADCGWQSNESTRSLSYLGQTSRSDYDSCTLGAGVKLGYDLLNGRETDWRVRPYVALDLTQYRQDSWRESGAGLYDQRASSFHNTYMTGETGLEVGREWGRVSGSVNAGYKRVLNGLNPGMAVAFAGEDSWRQIYGGRQGRDFLTLGLSAAVKLSARWRVTLRVESEQSSDSRALGASAGVRYMW